MTFSVAGDCRLYTPDCRGLYATDQGNYLLCVSGGAYWLDDGDMVPDEDLATFWITPLRVVTNP